jgi:hypothetical protein
MQIIVTKHELENPREFDELSSDLVGNVRGNVKKTHDTLSIDGLDVAEAGIALKTIRPYLA